MGVSKNRGTSKSSISIRFFIVNHPFCGTFIFGNINILGGSSLGKLGMNSHALEYGLREMPMMRFVRFTGLKYLPPNPRTPTGGWPPHLKPLSWIAMRNLAYLNSQLQSVYEQGLFNDNNTHRIRVWFVHLYLVDFVMVNVGKYTIHGSYGTITPSSGFCFLSPLQHQILPSFQAFKGDLWSKRETYFHTLILKFDLLSIDIHHPMATPFHLLHSSVLVVKIHKHKGFISRDVIINPFLRGGFNPLGKHAQVKLDHFSNLG